MQKTKRLNCLAAVGAAVLCCGSEAMMAATAPTLGTASGYSVLAGSAVTNTGTTSISGDVGIYPGIGSPPHVSGFGTVTLGGVLHDADVPAQNAMADQAAAYTWVDLNNACTVTYSGAIAELAGLSLVPGTYCATSFHLSSGTLTLVGSSSDVWVFKSASDLVITGGASAKVISPSCDVWWRVVSTASFDANSSLIGNILADTSITFAAGASLSGKAFARTAEVTLSSNVISGCLAPLPPTPTPTPAVTVTPTATPTPNLTPTVTPTPTPPFSGSAIPGLSGRAQLMMAAFLALAGFIAVRRFAA
jgi:hypothetical protein